MSRKHICFNSRYIQQHPEYVQEDPIYVRSYNPFFNAQKDTHNIQDFDSIHTAFCKAICNGLFPKNRIYAIAVDEKKLRAIKKGEFLGIDLYIYEHPYNDLDTLDDRHYRIQGDELIVLKEIPKEYQFTPPPIAPPIFKRNATPKLIWK
jgi:hypothetical protein